MIRGRSARGARELKEKLASLPYRGDSLPAELNLSSDRPVADYFRQFSGLDAGPRFNGRDFWTMPIPVTRDVDTDPDDVVIFDDEGYPALRDFLKKSKVRHILLTGHATDMCYCRTTAGYQNLSKDFNGFLVGDASLATFPSNASPRFATNAALSFAALDQLIMQVSWVRYTGPRTENPRSGECHAPEDGPEPSTIPGGGRGRRRRGCTGRVEAGADKTLIANTLDLEMSREFPTGADMHWDYEKGNLNAEAKAYAVEACRRVKAAGGVLHCFAVGRVFEQEDSGWLRGIAEAGHPVGNHTYDHVNVLATHPEDIQFRFRRAPWLIEGRAPSDVIRDKVRLATAAIRVRLGRGPAGFRTPGGFRDGLRDRPDVRAMLRDQGFGWVSSVYPAHEPPRPSEEPGAEIYEGIVAAQAMAQPFAYPDGLIEVPMSPISDVGAFRTGRWRLDWFLKAVRLGVE